MLNIDKKGIEQYLSEVKEAVENDRYRLERNARRQDNINLFLDYVIDEAKAKEIILGLTAMDFSEILQNKLENCFVNVISFHEQKYPLTYYFILINANNYRLHSITSERIGNSELKAAFKCGHEYK